MRRRTLSGIEEKVFAVEADRAAFEEYARTCSIEEYHALRITGGSFVLTEEVTMASAVLKNYRPIFDELRRQDWEVERTAEGHWRCIPPDKSKPIVHFAASDDPRALQNALAELRTSGFQYPPPSKAEERAQRSGDPNVRRTDKGPLMAVLGELPAFKELAEREAVEAAGATVPAPPPSAEVVCNPGESEEEMMNRVFRELKEAKAYVALTAEAREEAKTKLDEARTIYDEALRVAAAAYQEVVEASDSAEAEHAKAVKDLAGKKGVFDKAFNAASAA